LIGHFKVQASQPFARFNNNLKNFLTFSINQSINQSIILFSNAGYKKAAIRLMWTYNELIFFRRILQDVTLKKVEAKTK